MNYFMRCTSCQKENPPSHKFCSECGHILGETAEPLKGETPKLEEPQSYIPKHLAEKILESKTRLEGERKQVTVLFADVSGFTALSETLDPEEVRSLMNRCLHLIIEQIHTYEGTINKFTGDGVMALFGAPIAQEDHAVRAVSAALGMQRSLRSYGDELKERGDIDFRMRIGINTGLVVVGSIGNDLSMEYTAMGDTVNLASRLEGLAEPGTVYVSESTYKLVKDYFEFKSIGEVRAKGKSQPLLAYSPISQRARKGSFEICLERGLTRLVGREIELELLNDTLHEVREGKGQIVCIIGEAGLGKSRIVHEFKSTFGDDESEFLEGQCISYGKSFSYLPIIEILRQKFGIEEKDNDTQIKSKVESILTSMDANLKNSIPLILNLLNVQADSETVEEVDVGQKRQTIFEVIKTFLITESSISRLIIIIEDLHWIDKTSEDFLVYLAASVGNHRIMLLCTSRADVTQGLTETPYSRLIALNTLLERDCRMMILSILSDGNVSEELTSLIIGRSEGNPFFIEAVTESLLEAGIIIKDEKGYSIDKMVSNLQVPSTIQDVLMARIDRLDENRKKILQIGSVIGKEFGSELLLKVTDIDEFDLREHLLALASLGLIYEKGLSPKTSYVFGHALTHEVAYSNLLVQKRKEIHERIGIAIEVLYPNRLEEFYDILAYHFNRTDNSEKAYRYLNLAGKKAKEVFANDEALALFKDSIKHIDQLPKTELNERRKIDVLFEIENIYDVLARKGEQKNVLETLIDLSKGLNDETTLSDVYIKHAEFLSTVGDYQKAQEVGKSALTLKRKLGDRVGTGKALRGMGFIHWRSGEYGEALQYHNEALNVHRELGSLKEEGFELVGLGEIYRKLGRYEEALSCLNEALRIHRELGIKSSHKVCEFNIGSVYRDMGNYEACLEHYLECVRIIKEMEISLNSYANFAVPNGIANVYWRLGNYKESLKYYFEALGISRVLRDRREEGNILSYMASIYGLLADYQQSITHYRGALTIYKEIGDKVSEGRVHTLIGNLYRVNLLDYRSALTYYKEALEIYEEIGNIDEIRSVLNSIGVVCWNLNLYDEALSHYHEALEICKRTGNKAGEGITLSGMAVIYLSLRKYKEALECNQNALNILKPSGDQKVEGYILNSIGNVYYEMGDYHKAWKFYQESLKIRKELGDKRGEGWVLHNLGRVYRSLENYEEAKKHNEEALSLAEELGEEELVANSKNALSEVKK